MKQLRLALLVLALAAVAGAGIWMWRHEQSQSSTRSALFAEIQPVALKNCVFRRFGEPGDGGYVACENQLGTSESAYSYGISGYDDWGCEVSTAIHAPVHRYDCFNTTNPACPTGNAVFHAECIGTRTEVLEGRPFDTLQNQILKNGDAGKRLIVKMDVEGAEWDSLLQAPAEVLDRIDQMSVEFHIGRRVPLWSLTREGVPYFEERFTHAIQHLKQHFHVANLHFNNYSCLDGVEPFPARAFEVLFVNKRVVEADPAGRVTVPNAIDQPNRADRPDCQAVAAR